MFVSFVLLLEIAFASNIPSLRELLPNAPASAHRFSFVSPLFVLGVVCAFAGALVRLWSYQAMGVHFTFQLSIQKNHELITSGPYAYVRHPSYTALVVTMIGVLMCELSSGSWWMDASVFDTLVGKGIALLAGCCIAFGIQIVSRASKEDEMLAHRFGGEWFEWKRKVPYQFIPGVL